MLRLPFQNRIAAGRLLGDHLASSIPFQNQPVILGLPRGGVPVAAEVARALRGTLDVLTVRKLGVPSQPEFAMGAIAGDSVYLDERLIRELGISPSEVQKVAERETKELQRRKHIFCRGRRAIPLLGRAVILVDDGLATGATMIAAIRHARSAKPSALIVAAPVCSSAACQRVKKEGCDCVCLAQPEPFIAVGDWYADFRQVTDREVEELLELGL